MSSNSEYVLAAYGIVISVILIYGAGILLKLKSVNTKLRQIQSGSNKKENEAKES